MAEKLFEARLETMFAQAPAFADAELFTLRVAERLDRGWTARRVLIGGLGVVGGLIGGAQVLGSGLPARLSTVGARSDEYVGKGLSDLAAAHLLPAGFALNAEVLWMSAGLAVLALAFALTRTIKEF